MTLPGWAPLELLRELVRIRRPTRPAAKMRFASLVGDYLTGAGLHTQVLRSPGGRAWSRVSTTGPTARQFAALA